jgi:hypothetical protein
MLLPIGASWNEVLITEHWLGQSHLPVMLVEMSFIQLGYYALHIILVLTNRTQTCGNAFENVKYTQNAIAVCSMQDAGNSILPDYAALSSYHQS